jgi:hypothetical protein
MQSRALGSFWGAVLVVLGLLFLAANTGVLDRIDWNIAWPVLLIALGVGLLVTRAGSGAALGVVDASEPRDGLAGAKLEIAVGGAGIDVRSAPLADQLYRVHIDHSGPQAEVRFDRATGTVRISQPVTWGFGAGRRLRIDAQLSDAVPWNISCSTGAVRGVFDLASGQTAGFDCRTGASRIAINLPGPKGQVPVRIEGGGLRVDITRPAGAAMRVQASGGAVRLTADGTRQDGIGNREWRSQGFDSAADRYEVTVAGGAATVTVEERR